MELRHLRYFLAVAEERSFTAAAGRLGISQPPLSQQIKDLEVELATALFERTSRHVELTPAGISFLEHSRAILAQVKRAAQQARAIGSGQAGVIDIGTTGSVLLGRLAELIAVFGERHPGVVVRIHELGPQEQQDALLVHRLDISFLRRPRHEPELVSEIAWPEKVAVALPRGHPLAAHRQVPLAALKDQNLVFLRLADSRFARYLHDCCVQAGFLPRITHEVVESNSLTSLVAAGLGVALMPESVGHLSRPGVVHRPIRPPAPIADVSMVYRRSRSDLVDRFIELSRDRAKG